MFPQEFSLEVIHWAQTTRFTCHPGHPCPRMSMSMFQPRCAQNFHFPPCKTPETPTHTWSPVVSPSPRFSIDWFSKAVHFAALPKLPSALEIAEQLTQHVFRLICNPYDIISDWGPQFTQFTWKSHLAWVKYVHNSMTSAATGLLPFQALLGYQLPVCPAIKGETSVPLCRCCYLWRATCSTLLRTKEENKHLAIEPRLRPTRPARMFGCWQKAFLSVRSQRNCPD